MTLGQMTTMASSWWPMSYCCLPSNAALSVMGMMYRPVQDEGPAAALMDVCDELHIERLTWAVYDRVLCPGDQPILAVVSHGLGL